MKRVLSCSFGFFLAAPLAAQPPEGVYLESLAVETTLLGPAAETEIRAVFANGWDRDSEVVWTLPLPPWSAVLSADLGRGDRRLPTAPLPARRAREAYDTIRNRLLDPLLLEYAGPDAVGVSACPIPGRGRVEVRISLASLLQVAGPLREFRFPFGAFGPAVQGPLEVAAKVTLRGCLSPGAVFCPLPGARLDSSAGDGVAVAWKAAGKDAPDLRVLVPARRGPAALAVRPQGDEPGTFLTEFLLPLRTSSRRLILLVETSAAMKGPALGQMQAALRHLLAGLAPEDAFDLVFFNDKVRRVFPAPMLAQPGAVAQALAKAGRQRAGGKADLFAALVPALEQAERVPGTAIVLLGQGDPAGTAADPELLMPKVQKLRRGGARFLALLAGGGTLAHLVSQWVGGEVLQLAPGEAAGPKAARLLETLAALPVAEAEVRFCGIQVADPVPWGLPGLRSGANLPFLGRFDGSDAGEAVVQGKVLGREQSWRFPVDLGAAADGPAWLPALWAHLALETLLPRLREGREDQSLAEAAARFAGLGGALNPFVSLLAAEVESRGGVMGPGGSRATNYTNYGPFVGPTLTLMTGSSAIHSHWHGPSRPAGPGDVPAAPWEPCRKGSPASQDLAPATPGVKPTNRK